MADRTSAGIYGGLFDKLHADLKKIDAAAKRATADPLQTLGLKNQEHYLREFAGHVWGMSGGHDFHPKQMDCDDALVALGFAEERYDREHDETHIRFRDSDGAWPEWE